MHRAIHINLPSPAVLISVFAVCMKKHWVLPWLHKRCQVKTNQIIQICRLIWVFCGVEMWFFEDFVVPRLDCEVFTNWATSWQNQQIECAPSEDSDQPGHPPSRIRVFTVHTMGSLGPKVSSCRQWRLIRLGRYPGWSESSLGTYAI